MLSHFLHPIVVLFDIGKDTISISSTHCEWDNSQRKASFSAGRQLFSMSINPWTEEERQIVAQIDCEGTITGNEEGGDDIIDLSTVSRRGTTATIVAVTVNV